MSLVQIIWFSVFSAIYAHESIDVTDDLTSRILYGERANIKDYPYFARLANCGAAIISDRWLVTAAHCVEAHNLKQNTVWVGGESIENSQRYSFDTVIIHPEYSYIPKALFGVPVNDIALLRLSRPLTFGSKVKAVTLPQQEYERNAVYKFAGIGRNEGDSGSPLVRYEILVGVASFIGNPDCNSNRLGMFTNVAPLVTWIKSVTGIK